MTGMTRRGGQVPRRLLYQVAAVTLAGLAAGALLRYGWAQSPELGWRCGAIDAPGWCAVRHAVLVGLRGQGLGVIALVLGLTALLAREAHRVLILAAAGLGAAGLLLYSAELSAAAVLLAAMGAVRT
jgi:hypothetical protein